MQILRSDHRYSKYCPPVPGTKPDEKSSGFFCLSPINKDIGIEEVVAMRVLRCWR
jgi:hypothetical protein